MKVQPCGHTAHLGGRRLCRHLLGEGADDLDMCRVLRGVGLEYDLCCADCGRADGPPELVAACEGCVDRADEPLQVIRVIGQPGIRRRPEPVNAAVSRIALPVAPLDVAPVGDHPRQWLLLTDRELIRRHAGTGEIIARREIELPPVDATRARGRRLRYLVHAAPDGEFAVISPGYGQHAVLVDLAGERPAMALDRGTYHAERTPFPAAFLRVDGQLLLAHATAWNRVDLTDPVTGALVTPRAFEADQPRGRPAHFLDYFYGALHPAPDGRLIASDGWIWSPFGAPRVWDARRWRDVYPYEPEDGGSARALRFVRYYWSEPMCWLDDTRLALGGVGPDDEAMTAGVEIYDATSGTLVASFAGPAGPLHADGGRLFSSAPGGLEIWDVQTGSHTGTVPGFTPRWQHPASHELAALDGETLVVWPTR